MKKILPFLLACFVLSSCYVLRAYKYRDFDLKDVDKLHAVPLPASATPFHFSYDTLRYPKLTASLDSNLQDTYTYAFLVIRNDSILYERYFGNITEETKMPSFSVAKSVTSTLLGIALEEGYIKNLNEPITNYIPRLRKKKGFDKITIQQVLDMRSGVKSSEEYTNPFSDVLKMGFANNVRRPVWKAQIEAPPGQFEYKSVNTQILAMIIEQATGKKLQDYAIEKLWGPLHMEFPATWNADKKNTPRAFCCINAAALDYAKFGRLFLNNGAWQGRQIVPASWVQRSISADTMKAYEGYKNQWWAKPEYKTFTDSLEAAAYLKTTQAPLRIQKSDLSGRTTWTTSAYNGAFHAQGILGQYVYVNPPKKLIIVRLGHYWKHPKMWAEKFIYSIANEL